MELVRAFSATSSGSRTEVQRQNRGVSKWSYHYVKELLLSAPRAPKLIHPFVTDATAVAEFTPPPERPQSHPKSTIARSRCDNVATASASAPTLDERLHFTDGNRTDASAASQESAGVPPHANATESANAINETTPLRHWWE